MEEVDSKKVYDLFIKWSKENEGTWVNRSVNVAKVATEIAKVLRIRY